MYERNCNSQLPDHIISEIIYTKHHGRCISFRTKTNDMEPINEWIRLEYKSSALLDLFVFQNQEEISLLTGWYLNKLPASLKTNPIHPYTHVTITMKELRDSTGNSQCKDQGGPTLGWYLYNDLAHIHHATDKNTMALPHCLSQNFNYVIAIGCHISPGLNSLHYIVPEL